MPREIDVDPLPSAGTWADRRRFYGEGYESKRLASQVPSSVRAMAGDFAQLAAYNLHIAHRDFHRKGQAQQKELLQILRRLVERCMAWGSWPNSGQRQALDQARQLLTNAPRGSRCKTIQ